MDTQTQRDVLDSIRKMRQLAGLCEWMLTQQTSVKTEPTNGNGHGLEPPTGFNVPKEPDVLPINGSNGSNGNGSNSNGASRISAKQLGFLRKLCAQNKLPWNQLKDTCVADFNAVPEFLNKRQASALIERLIADHPGGAT